MIWTPTQLHQRQLILENIYTASPISRIDIAKTTGITPAKVTEITNTLLGAGLAEEVGTAVSPEGNAGRRKILLAISQEAAFFLGSELSEKHLTFCITDNKGIVKAEQVIPLTPSKREQAASASLYLEQLRQFRQAHAQYPLAAIGLAIPGHYDQENSAILTNNPLWRGFALQEVEDALDVPLFVANNVHCMTMAVKLFSRDNQGKNFSFLHVSRGMFHSYMYKGEIFAGEKHMIGEIGHTVVNPNGEICECGKKGCLQTYASEAWLLKKAQLLYEDSPRTFLRQLADSKDEVTIGHVLTAYKLGDEGARSLLQTAIQYLGISLINLSMLLDLEITFLHGEIFNEPTITALLREYIANNLSVIPSIPNPTVTVKDYSPLNAAMGATALCVSEYLIKGRKNPTL